MDGMGVRTRERRNTRAGKTRRGHWVEAQDVKSLKSILPVTVQTPPMTEDSLRHVSNEYTVRDENAELGGVSLLICRHGGRLPSHQSFREG